MFLQQRPILLLKRHLVMMLLLIADIFPHGCRIRDTHAESAISILPGEAASMFVHPFGRIGFEKLNGLGQRNGWRQVKRICAWSDMPLIAIGAISWLRQMPAR